MRTRQFLHATVLAAILSGTVFGVASADDCNGKKKKGCEVPEVPYSAVLPAVGMAGVAGFYLVQRRRSALRSDAAIESRDGR